MSGYDGAEEMARIAVDLTTAATAVVAQAGAATGKAIVDVQAHAQAIVPVDTGYLKSSISTEVSRDGSTVRGEVGPTANYGAYVELGTSRMRAQPYMRPATDAVVPSWVAAIEQIGGEIL